MIGKYTKTGMNKNEKKYFKIKKENETWVVDDKAW